MSSRIRTLGRLDKILYPFYKKDIDTGVLTNEEVKEMFKFFLLNLSAMNVPFNLPFAIGGGDGNGNEITNELSSIIVDAYGELDIYSPKIHVCVSDNTPKEFVFKVLRLIRAGKSSFVFANDKFIIDALKKVGISDSDAKNYVLIGCYEPTVYVDEIGCTGNGGVNSLKMIEYVFTRGYDYLSGEFIGLDTGEINSYSDFITAVKKQLEYATNNALRIISDIERDYDKFYADPMLSAMIDGCLSKGADAYTGSAKYNNSSFYFSLLIAILFIEKFKEELYE
jgi:formate C-acetyltransferase